MSQPGYEEDTLAHMFMAYGHDGPDRRLTLNDVWEVHMPTAWYIDKLLHCFSTGNQTPIDLLIAKGDEFHKQFMTLKETGKTHDCVVGDPIRDELKRRGVLLMSLEAGEFVEVVR